MSWVDLANSVCIYALSLGFEINDLTVLFSPIAVHLSELPYKLNDQNPVFIYKTFQFEEISAWNSAGIILQINGTIFEGIFKSVH